MLRLCSRHCELRIYVYVKASLYHSYATTWQVHVKHNRSYWKYSRITPWSVDMGSENPESQERFISATFFAWELWWQFCNVHTMQMRVLKVSITPRIYQVVRIVQRRSTAVSVRTQKTKKSAKIRVEKVSDKNCKLSETELVTRPHAVAIII